MGGHTASRLIAEFGRVSIVRQRKYVYLRVGAFVSKARAHILVERYGGTAHSGRSHTKQWWYVAEGGGIGQVGADLEGILDSLTKQRVVGLNVTLTEQLATILRNYGTVVYGTDRQIHVDEFFATFGRRSVRIRDVLWRD